MIQSAFEIDTDLQLKPLPLDRVVEASREKDGRVWLDLQEASAAEIEGWLDKFNITGLAKKICLDSDDRSGFYPLPKEMILVTPVQREKCTSEGPDHVLFYCREELMVTIHRQFKNDPADHEAVENAADWLPDRTIGSLFAAIMMDVTQACLKKSSVIRKVVVELEGRLDNDPDSLGADEVMDVRADLIALEVVVNDQLPPLQALTLTDRPGLNILGAREYLNCSLANLTAADRRLDRLDSRVSELRSGLQMHSQDKMNRRLGMLTILSAIFMPITLMAGIWGMNFVNMPELGLAFGYPLGLGAMAVVAIAMFLFFRKGGWFG